tara:strand:+ start:626 stop:1576 length:951 start_codon:yes stop_codon:yes gene_type:complete
MNLTTLNHHLQPLYNYLNDNTVSEIMINNEKELFIEKEGIMQRIENNLITNNYLQIITRLIANYNQKDLDKNNPSISGILPNQARVQIVTSPIVANNQFALSIRKETVEDVSLDNYDFKKSDTSYKNKFKLNLNSNVNEFLKDAINKKQNILISGGTSTGKTTFLNSCLKEIPTNERIITLEDTKEIKAPHLNQVNLIAAKENTNISMTDLLEISLRLRPDRIVIGEIRGTEAASFIEAIATGHDGTISTIHASTPELAISQLAIKAQRGYMNNLSKDELIKYIKSLIPVVIQLNKDYDSKTGKVKRHVSEIRYFG